jgi:hypothetical protein
MDDLEFKGLVDHITEEYIKNNVPPSQTIEKVAKHRAKLSKADIARLIQEANKNIYQRLYSTSKEKIYDYIAPKAEVEVPAIEGEMQKAAEMLREQSGAGETYGVGGVDVKANWALDIARKTNLRQLTEELKDEAIDLAYKLKRQIAKCADMIVDGVLNGEYSFVDAYRAVKEHAPNLQKTIMSMVHKRYEDPLIKIACSENAFVVSKVLDANHPIVMELKRLDDFYNDLVYEKVQSLKVLESLGGKNV